MGDNLAEMLYRAHADAKNKVVGSDVPSWANLRTAERDVWEAIASRARHELAPKMLTDVMVDAKAALGKLKAIDLHDHPHEKARMFVQNIIDTCERRLRS